MISLLRNRNLTISCPRDRLLTLITAKVTFLEMNPVFFVDSEWATFCALSLLLV